MADSEKLSSLVRRGSCNAQTWRGDA